MRDRAGDRPVGEVTDQPLDLAAHEAAVADRAGRRGGLLPGRGPRPRPRAAGDAAGVRGAPERRAGAARRWPPRSPPTPTCTRWRSRTGSARSAIGDVALVAAVSTAHRAAAFAACARLVDEVKARLPIWKRQVFADGTEEWVNCP